MTMHCQKTKGKYEAFFEEKQPKQWYGVRAEKFHESLLNKLSLKFNAERHAEAENSSPANDYEGTFFSGDMKCPYCGNDGFVKCGRCGELTCWNSSTNHFVCAACGNSGKVEGTISDLKATSGDGDDNSITKDKRGNGGMTLM